MRTEALRQTRDLLPNNGMQPTAAARPRLMPDRWADDQDEDRAVGKRAETP
jgi:hypothetical protein